MVAVAPLMFLAVVLAVPQSSAFTVARCEMVATESNDWPFSGFLELGISDSALGTQSNVAAKLRVNGLPDGDYSVHVYEFGDTSSASGLAMGGHFVGNCSSCRPPGVAQEVGELNNGQPIVSSGNTSMDVTWTETVAKLWGENSIIGRGVGIHAAGAMLPRLAQCVIGRTTVNPQYDFVQAPPNTTQAGCVLEATAHSTVSGRVNFTRPVSAAPGSQGLTVSWGVPQGLHSGNNGIHVHQFGDITDKNAAMSTGGHFFGNCSAAAPCRPPWAKAQEVGMLFNNGYINGSTSTLITPDGVVSDGGGHFTSSFGQMRDGIVSMALPGSGIVGRSVVVHQGKGAPRVAQCIIGVTSPEAAPPLDCEVAYHPWGSCSCSSDSPVGKQHRSGNVRRYPQNGGQQCPPLQQERSCLCDEMPPAAAQSICVLSPVRDSALSAGWVTMQLADATDGESDVTVLFDIQGLPDDQYTMHVHTWGDISSPDGTSTGDLFVGQCAGCRPAGQPQAVGLLQGGGSFSSVAGRAAGVFMDGAASLSGANSVVSRGLVVRRAGGGAVAAQCVIGRNFDVQTGIPPVVAPPAGSTQASCVLKPVAGAVPGVQGVFNVTTSSQGGARSAVSYGISQGLQPGVNGVHVHQFGNIYDNTAATSTGGHFFGNCSAAAPCRPPWAKAQEVGMLFNNGYINATSVGGGTQGMTLDMVVSLQGPESILGRSIVVHQGLGAPRVAQCVLGVADPAKAPPTDCVSQLSGWSPCLCTAGAYPPNQASQQLQVSPAAAGAGFGAQQRTRYTLQAPSNDGAVCPDNQLARPCACQTPYTDTLGLSVAAAAPPAPLQAVCVLSSRRIRGWVGFRTEPGATADTAVLFDIQGLPDDQYTMHVHTWGDISSPDGTSTGDLFVGQCAGCRPAGQPQAVGLLQGGGSFSSVAGRAAGVFMDGVVSLSGANSVVSRGLVVRRAGGGAVAAQCVIGRNADHMAAQPPPAASAAVCNLQPIVQLPTVPGGLSVGEPGSLWLAASELPAVPVLGAVRMQQGTDHVAVVWNVSAGLTPGFNSLHVHDWGNMWDQWRGMSTGGHFFGNCSAAAPCRPPWAKAQEVGMLFNNGYINGSFMGSLAGLQVVGASGAANAAQVATDTAAAASGGGAAAEAVRALTVAYGAKNDSIISLNGPDGVLGRSLVVHQGKGAPRVAQCVIGLAPQPSSEDCIVNDAPVYAETCVCSVNGTGFRREVRSVLRAPLGNGTNCAPLESIQACSCAQAAGAQQAQSAVSSALGDVPPGYLVGFFFLGAVAALALGAVALALCRRRFGSSTWAPGGRRRAYSKHGAADGSDVPYGVRGSGEADPYSAPPTQRQAVDVELAQVPTARPKASVLRPAPRTHVAPPSGSAQVNRKGSAVEVPTNPMGGAGGGAPTSLASTIVRAPTQG